MLWPDSFTNYFAPEVGRAAVAVLEAAGYEVVLPNGVGVLRADLDLDRPVAGGQAAHRAFVGDIGAAPGIRHPDRGAGAELYRGVAPGRGRTSA